MEIRGKWISRTKDTILACWKQNKTNIFFDEHSAFQSCLIEIYEAGGEMLGEGERINVGVFVFKWISRVNIVIKPWEFKFLCQCFTMKNIFWKAEGECQVWLLKGPMGLVDEWRTSYQLSMSDSFLYRLPLLGPRTITKRVWVLRDIVLKVINDWLLKDGLTRPGRVVTSECRVTLKVPTPFPWIVIAVQLTLEVL